MAELRHKVPHVTESGKVLMFNPDLQSVGDMVTRTMFLRIDTRVACLGAFRTVYRQAAQATKREASAAAQAEAKLWLELE